MLKQIERYFDLKALKEDLRKVGVSLITAGVVGVFINHYTGMRFSTMLITSFVISLFGIVFLCCGLVKLGGSQ
jgi:hypothetical protein